MTFADNTERATGRDLYDLYETYIALLDTSVRYTNHPICEYKSILLVNAALQYATTRRVLWSSFGMHISGR